MRRVLLYLFASLVLAFLFLPSFIVVPMSVTESIFLDFPPKGFTWRWYEWYFVGVNSSAHIPLYARATIMNVELAIAVILVAVPTGVLAAYGLSRGRFWGKNLLNALIVSPLIVPIMVTAVALFFFMSNSLPSFRKSPSGLSVPVWGEYALIFLAIGLGVVSIALLLFRTLYRKPMDDWEPKLVLWYDRLRPWATVTLLLTAAYLLIPWWVSSGHQWSSEDMLSARDPYPRVPMVSAGLVLAHVMLAVPYVTIIMSATLRNVRRSQDQAAAILGAGPIATLTRVVLPQMKPGLALAIIFSVLVSFNEVLITIFLSHESRGSGPFSNALWLAIRSLISPGEAAASTIALFLTIVLLGAAFFVYRRSEPAKARPA